MRALLRRPRVPLLPGLRAGYASSSKSAPSAPSEPLTLPASSASLASQPLSALSGSSAPCSSSFFPVLSSASGARVWDTAGRQYLDFSAWDAPLGHAPAPVVAAVAAQAATFSCLPSMPLPSLAQLHATASLRRILRMEDVLLLGSPGAGLNAATQIARRVAHRRGSQAKTILRVSSNTSSGLRYGNVAALEGALRSGSVAAVVVDALFLRESEKSEDNFLADVSALCREANALLVIDERRTALGRLGPMLVSAESLGCTPDLVILGQGISSGIVPFECVMARESGTVVDALRASRESTVSPVSPIACAAAHAMLTMVESEEQDLFREQTAAKGATFRKRLRRVIAGVDRSEFPVVVRGLGLVSSLRVGRAGDGISQKVAAMMARTGVLSTYENGLVLVAPPVGASERELTSAARVIRKAIHYVTNELSCAKAVLGGHTEGNENNVFESQAVDGNVASEPVESSFTEEVDFTGDEEASVEEMLSVEAALEDDDVTGTISQVWETGEPDYGAVAR